MTLLALERAWAPVGSCISERSEVTHVMRHLFSGEEGMDELRRLDRNLAKLPSLEGLTIFDGLLREYGVFAWLSAQFPRRSVDGHVRQCDADHERRIGDA